MWAKRAALVSLLAVAACGGNPWVEEDGAEPDVFGGSIYADDLNDQLTMDSMVYDSETQELVINNIPFDGATAENGQAIYTRTGALGASSFDRYEDAAGTLAYYAVFRRSESGATQAGAFATSSYIDFGIGGASAQRNSANVNLPNSGEYSFTGEYAAVRIYSDAAGVLDRPEYVTGDVEIEMDFGDFDDVGAIVGVISNRQLYDYNGNIIGPMDDFVSLAMTEIDRDTGIVTAGGASGISTDTATTMTSGQWTAILGGTEGTEIAGIVVLESADSSTSTELVRETGVFIAIR